MRSSNEDVEMRDVEDEDEEDEEDAVADELGKCRVEKANECPNVQQTRVKTRRSTKMPQKMRKKTNSRHWPKGRRTRNL